MSVNVYSVSVDIYDWPMAAGPLKDVEHCPTSCSAYLYHHPYAFLPEAEGCSLSVFPSVSLSPHILNYIRKRREGKKDDGNTAKNTSNLGQGMLFLFVT